MHTTEPYQSTDSAHHVTPGSTRGGSISLGTGKHPLQQVLRQSSDLLGTPETVMRLGG